MVSEVKHSEEKYRKKTVLILIVVEYGLGDIVGLVNGFVYVLILIVVEYGLGDFLIDGYGKPV